MIILFEENETAFNHNGICILDECRVAEVQEELNGQYELYIEYPVRAKKRKELVKHRIIKCSTPTGEQLFRIYRSKKSMSTVHVYARHIFYDLIDNLVEDTNIVGKNGAGALEQLLGATQYGHNFRSMSDISTMNNSRLVRKNPVQAILSNEDNSFLNRWGGEIVRDNFDIKLYQKRGTDRGAVIEYGKNLESIEEELLLDEVVTRIMPMGFDGLLLPEKYVDSPILHNYIHPKISVVEFGDIKAIREGSETNDEDALPLEEAYQALRNAAKSMFDIQKVDIPRASYTINFIELSKTEEYKGYAVLERAFLGDTIRVKHLDLGIDLQTKVIKYVYDALSNKYEVLELGDSKNNFVDTVNKIEDIKDKVTEIETSVLEQAKKSASDLINSGFGGFVRVHPDRILIMDTEDENTALKVWQWNQNGLGYSSTGINGPYGLAMTRDGAIVADFITVGKLHGQMIESGTLKTGSLEVAAVTEIRDGLATIEQVSSVIADVNGFKSTVSTDYSTKNEVVAEAKRLEAVAQEKANAAQQAAEAVAQAEANLAKELAEAYADGIVTEEEKARIEQAKANLEEAKNDAKTKADAAEQAAKDYTTNQLKDYVTETKFSEFKQDVDGFKTTVSQTYTNKEAFEAEAKRLEQVSKDKAEEARVSAEAVAIAESRLAKELAEAYADGIVTEEEKARIEQAQANLTEAKNDAKTKADAAEKASKEHTENQLKGYVTNTKYTELEQTVNSIKATAVDTDGVKSVIEQTPSSVKVGFNGINNNIVMSENGLEINQGNLSVKRKDGYTAIHTGILDGDFAITPTYPPFVSPNVSLAMQYFYSTTSTTWQWFGFWNFKHTARYLVVEFVAVNTWESAWCDFGICSSIGNIQGTLIGQGAQFGKNNAGSDYGTDIVRVVVDFGALLVGVTDAAGNVITNARPSGLRRSFYTVMRNRGNVANNTAYVRILRAYMTDNP